MDNKNISATTVDLSGLTDFRTVTEAHEKLLAAMNQARGGSIAISVPEDGDIDISFVQLLQATRRMAKINNTRLALTSPATGTLLNTLRRSGFINTYTDNFWLAKSED